MKKAKVKDIIKILQKLPQNLPCYVRPKYHGDLSWTDDCPINLNGISEMESKKLKKHVTFLV